MPGVIRNRYHTNIKSERTCPVYAGLSSQRQQLRQNLTELGQAVVPVGIINSLMLPAQAI